MNAQFRAMVIKTLSFIPDKIYLSAMFRSKMGKSINWKNPQTFNEKLQWLKLNNRNPLFTKLVDKIDVKEYISEKLGSEYIIPTLGVWERFEDIDFSALPDQFVLKCSHDSGGLVIVKDKSKLDVEAARNVINASMKQNYYHYGREWPYKNVKPRIIAEEYLSAIDGGKEMVEYKFFCFNGKVKMILVCKGTAHGGGRTNDYCDINLKRFPFTSLNPNSKGDLPMPAEMPELLKIAETLSMGIPQLRVDTYLVDGKIYFGELTFFHNSGFAKFDPPEWDETLGSWIEL